MKMRLLIVIIGCSLPLTFCTSRREPIAKIAPSSGKALCSALAPADFAKADVPVSSFVSANLYPADGSGAYCTYKGDGGNNVEFDVFYPAGNTPEEVRATEKTMLSDGSGGKSQPIVIPGADSAQINLAIPGSPTSASITVRKSATVFAIYIPANRKAQEQLVSLAHTVLTRLQP
jgi:hypothetical protein